MKTKCVYESAVYNTKTQNDFISWLNKFGKDKWQLVHMEHSVSSSEIIVIFMREVCIDPLEYF